MFGLPQEFKSDEGPAYTSAVIEELCKYFATEHKFSPPYRPQANPVERTNKEVMRHVRSIVMDKRVREKVVDYLPMVERIVNSAYQHSKGNPPMRLLFGDSITLDRGLLTVWKPPGREMFYENYVQELTEQVAYMVAASQLHQSREMEKHMRKDPENPDFFNPGDYVAASWPHDQRPHKLAPLWRGPLLIVDRIGNLYHCMDLVTEEIVSIDLDRLKRYHLSEDQNLYDIALRDREEFLIDSIIDHEGDGHRLRDLYFKVRWAGFEPSEDSWLVHAKVKHCAALDRYLLEHPELKIAYRR
jgi:hypothetical protein